MFRKLAFACLTLAVAPLATAQKYEPTWDSIDARPTPAWWGDAKFGIFIHWGVYSVPAFAPKGEYAEWYWERLRKPGKPDASANDAKIRRETRAFHERVYGKDFEYQDFAPQFTRRDVRRRPMGGHLRSARARSTWCWFPSTTTASRCGPRAKRTRAGAGPGMRWMSGRNATSSASSPPPCAAAISRWGSISRCTSGSTRAGLPAT